MTDRQCSYLQKDYNFQKRRILNYILALLAECDDPPTLSSRSTGPYWENWLRLERQQCQAWRPDSTIPAQQS
ncbi:hypothetical protein AGOR_G00061160 [Albula goreensis]|uniref:Uncharacterized protein n=1 Tax=Albula goreensis TaxID=1534307 RepID=A0A8T3DXK0_9TELE|nr:hypothetical protein AGOR_G00061160 [Albula goreensis]